MIRRIDYDSINDDNDTRSEKVTNETSKWSEPKIVILINFKEWGKILLLAPDRYDIYKRICAQ